MSVEGYDKTKRLFALLVKHFAPSIDHLALYPATVKAQHGQLVDVQPDSTTCPAMSNVPLRVGAGIEVDLDLSKNPRVLLGFDGGDASKPYATIGYGEGLQQLRLGIGATDGVALASKVHAQLQALMDAFSAWTPLSGDGGAALKTQLTAHLGLTWPADVGSALVKAKDNP